MTDSDINLDIARRHYLEHQWQQDSGIYPTRPVSHDIAGRIRSVDRDWVDLELSLGQFQSFLIPSPWSARLRRGDWISGRSLRTETGFLLQDLILLAPMRAAFEGSKEREQARQKKEWLEKWNQFLFYVRQFFVEQSFLEIQTPTLVVCPGTEPFLDVFESELVVGRSRQKLFLPTSPELSLKKALALGFDKIFEVRSCFRNGEISETHQPEFSMLEWYRHYATLEQIQADVEKLVHFLAQKFSLPMESLKFERKSMAELFKSECDFLLTPQSTAAELKSLAEKWGVQVGSSLEFDDLFFHIFLEKIERKIAVHHPLFLGDYPPSQAALARLTKAGWGDRFEFYWKGLEIANAFHELNNPTLQRQRSQADLLHKQRLGKTAVPEDLEFFSALDQGLPPSAGIALGLDRLFMALFDLKDIRQIRLFPYQIQN